MKINLTTFFSGLGVTSGNTQATNFYDFWKGIIMNGETEINDITDFMTYLGTTRYEFFHSLESTYPDVWDEYTFYQNIDDPRIYDFKTFYTYAGEYLGSSPIPTPFRWDYTEWAVPDCGQPSGNQFYTTTEFPLPGDTVYSDSGLTTTFVGVGLNNYYSWGLQTESDARGSWEIDSDGTILSNYGNCVNAFTTSSGLTSPDCDAVLNDTLIGSLNPIVNSSRFWVLNGDNNIIGYFNGENKYYRYFNGIFSVVWRINNEGLLTEEISCPLPTPTPTATPTPTPSITPTPTPTPSPTTPVLKSVTNLAFRQDDTGNKSQFEFLGATGQTTSGLNTLMIASPNNLNITSITYSGYSCTKAIDIYTSEAGFLAIYYVNLPVSVISPTIVINLGSASRAISIDMRRINNATYSYPVSTYSISGTTSLATSTPNTISTDRVLFITGAYGCNGFTFNNGTGIYEPTCFTSTSFVSESGYNSSNPTSTFNNTVFRPLGNTIVNYLSAVFR